MGPSMRVLRPFPLLMALALASCDDERLSDELGARCVSQDDCERVCLVDGPLYPGGMCSSSCASAGDCASGAVCAMSGNSVCLFACRDDRDCAFLGEHEGREWLCHTVDAPAGGESLLACLGPGE